MRKLLRTLGTISLVIVTVSIIGCSYLIYNTSRVRAEGRIAAEELIREILADRTVEGLLARSTPEMRGAADMRVVPTLVDGLQKLGDLIKYEGAVDSGQATIGMNSNGTTATASYVAKAQFANGQGTFTMTIVKHDNRWLVQAMHINFAMAAPGNVKA